ncbi:CheY-like chemotaxis protein [Thalassospira sp. MBR-102]|jgi:CheY-like chemotaxis protein|uniref:Response regulator n=3 Tax=Thalassospira TaxID=168934 RepID=A0ABR5Y7B1_9PROT|nr:MULTISPECIES: response regulator [Thalassospira]MBR9779091.1 response regulator [Rhodospirillales bacterium]AJD53920.1 histidine kinase [Thalassospira xiamenensis M-5 = DSM 17429]KEO58315.1 response regulator [Thalassospira permensis NBRC 106175]KZD06634.1 response regulator [Thalassospira xiamenensis]KZD10767.1 response regulator [Thalassospira xiamenensis]|tara:strand:- start:11460 stop:11864 length:405 start_codon:yes stop_codon:yes gene_type:complete
MAAGNDLLIVGVDDDPKSLVLLKRIVESGGYSFVGVSSGKELLEVLKTKKPRIILMDIMMPGMNGFETSLRVRTGFPDRACAIIYVTARQGEEDLRGGVAAGGNDFVLKPINREKLLSRIEKWIGRVHTIKTAV